MQGEAKGREKKGEWLKGRGGKKRKGRRGRGGKAVEGREVEGSREGRWQEEEEERRMKLWEAEGRRGGGDGTGGGKGGAPSSRRPPSSALRCRRGRSRLRCAGCSSRAAPGPPAVQREGRGESIHRDPRHVIPIRAPHSPRQTDDDPDMISDNDKGHWKRRMGDEAWKGRTSGCRLTKSASMLP